jgi:hypothetical protein
LFPARDEDHYPLRSETRRFGEMEFAGSKPRSIKITVWHSLAASANGSYLSGANEAAAPHRITDEPAHER